MKHETALCTTTLDFIYSDVAGIKQIQFTEDLDIAQVLDNYYGKDI